MSSACILFCVTVSFLVHLDSRLKAPYDTAEKQYQCLQDTVYNTRQRQQMARTRNQSHPESCTFVHLRFHKVIVRSLYRHVAATAYLG